MFPEDLEKTVKDSSQEPEKVSEEETNDILGMSDEDISNMSLEEFAAKQKEEEPKEEEEEQKEEEQEEESSVEDIEEEIEDFQERDYFQQESSENEETEEETTFEETVVDSGNTVDYKAEYEKLLTPFRASDRTIKIKSVDEARKLMQMGVDYSKKMEGMKPHLRVLKALENNELLDTNKVNHLIEVAKGKPEAITKLLKDYNLNPMDLDVDSESDYTPNSYTPTEQELTLDNVLDSIKHTDSYTKTLDEIGNKWDNQSRSVLMEHPQLIAKLNEQVGNGIYDQIMDVVEKERMLGNLVGVPTVQAYQIVGDQLFRKVNGDSSQLTPEPKSEKPQQRRDPEVTKAKKKAAAVPKGSPKKSEGSKFNPLSMSDDEFEKLSSRYA